MSDDRLILGMVAAIGLVALVLTPRQPDPPHGYIGCDGHGGFTIRYMEFDSRSANLQIIGSCE